MTLRASIQISLRALSRNKLQTALTMVGMTIGVATVLTMIAVGSGAENAIQDQVKAAGMNMIVVTAGNYKLKTDDDFGVVENAWRHRDDSLQPVFQTVVWNQRQRARMILVHPEDDPLEKHDHPIASQRLGDSEAGLGAAATLTSGDAGAIRKLRGVQFVSEGVHQNVHVQAGENRWFTRIHGDDASLPRIRRAWIFSSGRFYSRGELSKATQVVVLGAVASRKLFGDANPVGRSVTIWKQSFEVVGVVSSGSWMVPETPGDDQFDAVYVPFTTVHKLLNLSKLNDITITCASSGEVTRVSTSVTNLLRKRHTISSAAPDDFTVASQARKALAGGGMRPELAKAVVGNVSGFEKVTLEQLGKTLDRASRTMTALLASIAAVSLLVGGIGIMNIMLLSVTERTREIGIRRAVGARGTDVLRQFLIEAIVLSAAGGLAGVIIGFIVSGSISSVTQWTTSISPVSVVISLGVAAAVGIFFGYYPAKQASRVLPIESLRYE
ncbi:MAG: putative transport system permease protein [Bryobacterales bacterium]|jgi:putative ABC transport system permease protein|nr:putative transport system permease protein [Bryobacterales bacterium]